VRGLDSDKSLVRLSAARLAVDDLDAQRLRVELTQEVTGEQPRRGGIFAALRRSPMVGVELDLAHDVTEGRDIDLWHAT
jgi:hypothetical protein